MSNSVAIADRVAGRSHAEATSTAIPWYLWCSVLAVTSAMIGIQWDISWHMSIGRDTFWTPAHIAIYMCGILAGISCAYLILSTTFGKLTAREANVRVLGLRGPFGAFVAAWGGAAMITSAPFDNWWHNAYGLDVKILSPPHTLLTAGIICVEFGSLLMILSKLHRAEPNLREKLSWLYLYIGSAILSLLMVMIYEQTSRVLMHDAFFYRTVCLAAPCALIAIARASGHRWAHSIITGFYMAFWIAMLWILPLQPAEPKLGPVYNQITHLTPMAFPLLLVAPGLVLDWLFARLKMENKWLLAILAAAAFLLPLFAVQWFFGDFLMSPLSRNAVFGTHYLAYFQPPDDAEVRNVFYYTEHSTWEFWKGMAFALLAAVLMSRLGLSLGEWMKKIRR